MATLLVLHGPNLNLLGTREPDKYGATTLAEINQDLELRAREAGHHLMYLQSNAEYELRLTDVLDREGNDRVDPATLDCS